MNDEQKNLLACGYVREQCKLQNIPLLPEDIIGLLINWLSLFKFMNGINILTRDWQRGQEIEYDSDVADKYKPGSHAHQGKLININKGVGGSYKIIFKDSSGYYAAYALIDVKLKLRDDGTKILKYHEIKMNAGHVASPGARQKIYDEFILEENLLFREGRARQEIEYIFDVEVEDIQQQHIHKGVIEELVYGDHSET